MFLSVPHASSSFSQSWYTYHLQSGNGHFGGKKPAKYIGARVVFKSNVKITIVFGVAEMNSVNPEYEH